MRSPTDELIAQLFFWSAAGSLPLAFAAHLCAARIAARKLAVIVLLAGSLLLSYFLWYAWNFAHGLAGNSSFVYEWAPWPYFCLTSFVISGIVALFSGRKGKTSGRSHNEDKPAREIEK